MCERVSRKKEVRSREKRMSSNRNHERFIYVPTEPIPLTLPQSSCDESLAGHAEMAPRLLLPRRKERPMVSVFVENAHAKWRFSARAHGVGGLVRWNDSAMDARNGRLLLGQG